MEERASGLVEEEEAEAAAEAAAAAFVALVASTVTLGGATRTHASTQSDAPHSNGASAWAAADEASACASAATAAATAAWSPPTDTDTVISKSVRVNSAELTLMDDSGRLRCDARAAATAADASGGEKPMEVPASRVNRSATTPAVTVKEDSARCAPLDGSIAARSAASIALVLSAPLLDTKPADSSCTISPDSVYATASVSVDDVGAPPAGKLPALPLPTSPAMVAPPEDEGEADGFTAAVQLVVDVLFFGPLQDDVASALSASKGAGSDSGRRGEASEAVAEAVPANALLCSAAARGARQARRRGRRSRSGAKSVRN